MYHTLTAELEAGLIVLVNSDGEGEDECELDPKLKSLAAHFEGKPARRFYSELKAGNDTLHAVEEYDPEWGDINRVWRKQAA